MKKTGLPGLKSWPTTALAIVAAAAVLGLSPVLVGQDFSPATPATTANQAVMALASDRMEGRLTGTAGERAAGDYIIAELRRIGAKPLPGHTDYRLPFQFTSGSRDGGSEISISANGSTDAVGRRTYDERAEVRALSFSDDGTVAGPVVFAGYGIVVPDSQNFGYDSYAALDVRDKVVLVLRYFPEEADAQAKGILVRYSDLRYKALAARQRGAKALLVVTGPHSPNAGETIPMTFDTALSGSGIVAQSIAANVAAALFQGSGHTLDEAQSALDSGNPHVAGFDLPHAATVRSSVVRERRTGNDIAAYLPATGPTASVAKPWVAIGAHYDHLGRGEAGNSLANSDEKGLIHHGADDNASGTAAVLAVGETLSHQARHRNLLLTLWSGEELGLLGSAAFAAAPPIALDNLAAYINFDMVGRMQDNKLTVQATGTSPIWPRLLEQANVSAGFNLLLQDDPYQPTDVATFNQAGIPCLNFFTGIHPDYHRPSDTADKIDYDDLDRIVGFSSAIVARLLDLDMAPMFAKVEPKASGASMAGVRVYTGTIPDYSTEVKGLLLSGVTGGGPAEAAGLRKGDVIVEIAGQTITNIYDYTYALDVLKIGVPTKVIYLRDGQRKEGLLTPAARK